jgi:hypothetical protein
MGNERACGLQAEELRSEGELCTTLGIASWGAERPLTQDEVDQLLGVRPRSPA